MGSHSERCRLVRRREFLKWRVLPALIGPGLLALVIAFKRWQPERAAQLRQWLWGPDENASVVVLVAALVALFAMLFKPPKWSPELEAREDRMVTSSRSDCSGS